MGALLKALGLTIWGLVAFGLLAIFIFVGYQAAVKFRSPALASADTHSPPVLSDGSPVLAPFGGGAAKGENSAPKIPEATSKPTALDATRKRFDQAAEQRRFAAVLDYGKQLYDAGLASPEDLLIMAHAFSAIGDCDNAVAWTQRANDALLTVGRTSELSAGATVKCNHDVPPPFAARNTANTPLANRFVKLGELYYGFGDYQQAVVAIQRGLDIGGATHLDEAYVYLGQSQLKLNNAAAACRSFRSLRGVPNLDPRIVKLWELFADTQC